MKLAVVNIINRFYENNNSYENFDLYINSELNTHIMELINSFSKKHYKSMIEIKLHDEYKYTKDYNEAYNVLEDITSMFSNEDNLIVCYIPNEFYKMKRINECIYFEEILSKLGYTDIVYNDNNTRIYVYMNYIAKTAIY